MSCLIKRSTTVTVRLPTSACPLLVCRRTALSHDPPLLFLFLPAKSICYLNFQSIHTPCSTFTACLPLLSIPEPQVILLHMMWMTRRSGHMLLLATLEKAALQQSTRDITRPVALALAFRISLIVEHLLSGNKTTSCYQDCEARQPNCEAV